MCLVFIQPLSILIVFHDNSISSVYINKYMFELWKRCYRFTANRNWLKETKKNKDEEREIERMNNERLNGAFENQQRFFFSSLQFRLIIKSNYWCWRNFEGRKLNRLYHKHFWQEMKATEESSFAQHFQLSRLHGIHTHVVQLLFMNCMAKRNLITLLWRFFFFSGSYLCLDLLHRK